MSETSNANHTVVVLSGDLFFGMRIRNALKQMGFITVLVKTEAEFIEVLRTGNCVLAFVDVNRPVEWSSITGMIAANEGTPTIAFGPHTDADAFRKAKEAGVTRVISNGAFSEQLPKLVERYARTT